MTAAVAAPIRDPIDELGVNELEVIIESWPTESAPRRQTEFVPDIGALRQWHTELKCGARKLKTVDALSRAACAEANARDAFRLGVPEIAYSYREDAVRLVLAAAAERGAA